MGDKPGTRAETSKKLELMVEQPPFLSKERGDKKGDKKADKPRNKSRNQQEAGNPDGTDSFFEQRNKRQERRQAPELLVSSFFAEKTSLFHHDFSFLLVTVSHSPTR